MHKAWKATMGAIASVGMAVTGLIATTSQPAEAVTGCQISVTGLPSKITLDSNDRRYWVNGWSKNCPRLDESNSDVTAKVVGPNNLRDYADYFFTDFGSEDHISLWTSNFKAGKYTVIDDGSFIEDADYNDLHYSWVNKTIIAKYRTYTSLAAKRSGKSVRISGTVKRYEPDAFGYVGYKRPVAIQRYTHGAWHTFKTIWSSSGRYAYSYSTTHRYAYRATIAETSIALSSKSGTHTV
jgi:hypothetical protein